MIKAKPLNRVQCYTYVKKLQKMEIYVNELERIYATLVDYPERFTRKQLKKLRINPQLLKADQLRAYRVGAVTYSAGKIINVVLDEQMKEDRLKLDKVAILISLLALVVAIAAYSNT